MEALNEQQYPLVKLVLEQALEPELVRVQALQVQVLVRVQLEPLVQLELRQTQAHPKALDMTPLTLAQRELQVLEQAQVPEREQRQERAAQLAQELVRRAQQEPLELQVQELEPASELRVSLERLPLRQGLTQHI